MGAGRILASGCCIGVLILVGVDVARAGEVETFGGYKYVTVERFGEPGSTKTVSAKCPRGTHVLGGGGESGGGFGDTFISSSFPFDGRDRDSKPDDGWKATHSSFDDVRELYADAVCGSQMPVYRKEEFEAAPEDRLQVAIDCGGGPAIIHGGLRGAASVQPVASYPFDGSGNQDSWQLTADNVSEKPRSVKGYAICSDELAVTYVPTAQEADPVVQDFGETPCPPDTPNAIGGGLVIAPPFGSFRWNSNAFDISSGSPLQWTLGVEAEFGGNAIPYTLWADCVPDVDSFP